jgi:rare lipoprotein A
MRLFYWALMGVLLAGCQSNQMSRQGEQESNGREFTITHPVDPNTADYEYPTHRTHKKRYPVRHDASEEPTDTPSARHSYTASERDGAPPGPPPVSFKKVVPKQEPISRYGNPAVYNVMGKEYHVMTNPTGYKSRGIASWYGTKFHAERTSSGEKYDMYALTAAHKTLPLPTYVRVKNLENGKMAIVKVNDRGPFHESRILDLSFAAATKLGVFPKGTAQVEIEALKTTDHQLNYYLQAGAFQSSELAELLKNKLGNITTSPVYVQKHENRYMVQLGPFADKEMVDQLKQQLENHQIHGSFSLLM